MTRFSLQQHERICFLLFLPVSERSDVTPLGEPRLLNFRLLCSFAKAALSTPGISAAGFGGKWGLVQNRFQTVLATLILCNLHYKELE
jgi:hypothetical protein